MSVNPEDKILIARAEDVLNLCEKQNCIKFLGFLTPAEAETVRWDLHKSHIQTAFYGGYPDCERVLFVALPDYLEPEDASQLISVIEVTGREIDGLRHPDFLGSLLGLGIKREKIGDILVLEGKCLIFVVENIARYITENLDKVGRKGVKARIITADEAEIPPRRAELIRSTVAALRLDAVVAAAIRTSRSGAAAALAEGRVFVNWSQNDNPSYKIKPGDVFSVRGCGRFRLTEEITETRKGRVGICIEKMI